MPGLWASMGKGCVMSGKPTHLQGKFDFGRSFGCDSFFADSMLALRDAYQAAGNLVVAGATGIDESDLPKMFKPGSGRHLRYEAVFKIGALQSTGLELRRRILAPLATSFGFELTEREPLTPEERADTAEAVIAALGPIAQEAYARALGGRK